MISAPSKVIDFPDGKQKIIIQLPTPNKPGTVKINIHLKNDSVLSLDQSIEYNFEVLKKSKDETLLTKVDYDDDDDYTDSHDDQLVPSDG